MSATTICDVRAWSANLDLKRPYTIAYKTIDHVENVFVTLRTENGLTGIGAGSPAEMVTGENFAASAAWLENHLASILLGKDIREINSILRQLEPAAHLFPASCAAIDIALHDALAKHLDLPLAAVLGQCHAALPTSVTIGIQSISESLAMAAEFVAEGFRILKIKTGHDVAADVELMAKIREQFGHSILIRVDANQGYSTSDLLRFVKETAAYDIELIEQPISAKNWPLMEEVPETVRRICAADECLKRPEDGLAMAGPTRPFGIYNIKLMKCGGVAPARSIAAIAHLAGIELMWGCNDESVVSISAALHTALSCPATRYLDLDGSFDLAKDIAAGGFVVQDGKMSLAGGPGLGVTWSV